MDANIPQTPQRTSRAPVDSQNASQTRGEAQQGPSSSQPDIISTLEQKSPTAPVNGLSGQNQEKQVKGIPNNNLQSLANADLFQQNQENHQKAKALENGDSHYWTNSPAVTDGVAKVLMQDEVRDTEKRLHTPEKRKNRILLLMLLVVLVFYVIFILKNI